MKNFKQRENRSRPSGASFSEKRTNRDPSHWQPIRKAELNSLLCWKHSAHERKYASNTFKHFLITGRALSILSLPLERRSSHEVAKNNDVVLGCPPRVVRL